MDIAGTKKKIQRATTVAEESYKKINELLDKIQRLQEDMETTSRQVDRLEYDIAQQRAIIEAMAENEGLDVEEIIEAADLPEQPSVGAEAKEGETDETAQMATSRPSANDESDE